jgi:hypothetical protein
MNENINSEQAGFLAELKCINYHIDTIKELLKLDYSKFDNKVLNIKLEKFIDKSIVYKQYENNKEGGNNFISLYLLDASVHFGKINKDNYQACLYASYYRGILVPFNIIDKRIQVKSIIEGLEKTLEKLENAKKEYQFKFDNYNNNETLLDAEFKKINDIMQALSYENFNKIKDRIKSNFHKGV